MSFRVLLLAFCCGALVGCGDFGHGIQINSGSYDWTDQVKDAHGYPLPGWGNAIFGGGVPDGTR